jgi:hypothetical protein
MARVKRLASSLLLAVGIVLVFAGLNAALGFSLGGMIASVAAIATLLYAGAVWFGPPPPTLAPAGGELVIVFDRSLHIVAGATPGAPLLHQFPAAMRDAVEPHCRAALAGDHSHFACEFGGRHMEFEVAPVQMMGGAVLYGVLIAGSGTPVPAATRRPVTTVA